MMKFIVRIREIVKAFICRRKARKFMLTMDYKQKYMMQRWGNRKKESFSNYITEDNMSWEESYYKVTGGKDV